MNHLAHFSVSHPERPLIIGAFLGDFVKGRLKGDYPTAVERGIHLHRSVDAFSDNHPVVRRSVARFSPEFRRFGPIMVDVIFDHFLARRWRQWHKQHISRFCDDVFEALENGDLPSDAARVAKRMNRSRAIERYGEDAFIEGALTSISRRLTRPNPLDRGFDEFAKNREELSRDFDLFFPQLLTFSQQWRQDHR